MVTIGVAVQAETFSDTNPSPVQNLDPTSPFPSKSVSAIYLPPSKDGSPQTLRITFNYNKDTNLPEIVVNLDGKDNEDKYLELKELCRGNVNGIEDTPPEIVGKPKESSSTEGDNPGKEEVQVYYFNEIKMDSEKKVGTNETDVPGSVSTDPAPATGSEANQDIGDEERKTSCENNSENVSGSDSKVSESKNNTEKSEMSNNGKIKKQKKSNVKTTPTPENRGTSMSPTRRATSPSKIPIIHSSATGFMSCDYYRQKLLQDMGCTDFTNPHWTPHYYTSIQKTAGQKVSQVKLRLLF